MVVIKRFAVFFSVRNGSRGRVGATEGGVAICGRGEGDEEKEGGEEEEGEGEESVCLG